MKTRLVRVHSFPMCSLGLAMLFAFYSIVFICSAYLTINIESPLVLNLMERTPLGLTEAFVIDMQKDKPNNWANKPSYFDGVFKELCELLVRPYVFVTEGFPLNCCYHLRTNKIMAPDITVNNRLRIQKQFIQTCQLFLVKCKRL